MKLKHCPECEQDLPREVFSSTRAKYCNPCKRIRQLEQQKAMQERSLKRLKSKKQKTKGVIRISDLKKKAQRVFNKWIRERDKYDPCLACGRTGVPMDASHFFPMGSNGSLRYHEDNVHNTCVSCNRFKHGNLLLYRIGLVKKIGEQRVKYLEENHKEIHKFTREELEEIIERYT